MSCYPKFADVHFHKRQLVKVTVINYQNTILKLRNKNFIRETFFVCVKNCKIPEKRTQYLSSYSADMKMIMS